MTLSAVAALNSECISSRTEHHQHHVVLTDICRTFHRTGKCEATKKQLLKVQKVKVIGSIFSNPICVKMQIIHERKIHEYVEGKILAPKANRTNYKVERNTKKQNETSEDGNTTYYMYEMQKLWF